MYGDPDADVWRTIIRNHGALSDLRHEIFSIFALNDPKSASRKRPAYDKELLEWRAQLRPFLVDNDGLPAKERPLESMSGVPLCQDAANLLQIGQSRRKALFMDHLQNGVLSDHRPKQEPVKIALEEDDRYDEVHDVAGQMDCEVGAFYEDSDACHGGTGDTL